MDFKFDSRAFKRDLDRQVRSAGSSALDEIARDYERLFARFSASHRGQPVETIKPALQREWRKISNRPLREPDLTHYARAISDGAKVEFRPQLD